MTPLKRILHISRPRFWVYEFGTFIFFGVCGGLVSQTGSSFDIFLIALWAFYFLVPANILIYGINDIYDYETDKLNPKKVEYETLVTPKEAKKVWIWVFATTIPFLFTIPFMSLQAVAALFVFFFCAIFYSALPIRAKARPAIDALFSAGHYVATGVFGYYLVGGIHFPLFGVLAGIFWCMAMHAFSAVPDIEADTEAGLSTIATKFGFNRTLQICIFLYVLSSVSIFFVQPVLAIFWATFYVSVVMYSLKNKNQLFLIYKHFPLINSLCGMTFSLWIIYRLVF